LESSAALGLSGEKVSSFPEGGLITDLVGSVVWIKLGRNFCEILEGRKIADF